MLLNKRKKIKSGETCKCINYAANNYSINGITLLILFFQEISENFLIGTSRRTLKKSILKHPRFFVISCHQ